MTEWEEIIGPFPFMVAIIGDVGEGKTGTMASIAEHYKGDAPGGVYLVADRNVHRHWPDWIRRINPEDIHIPNDAILMIDDAHLYYHSRDWAGGKGRLLDLLSRARRQVNSGVILTSQEARVVDINLLSMLSALIIKRPTQLMRKFERSEIQPLLNKAYREIGELDRAEKDADPPRFPPHAFVVSNYLDEEQVIEVDLPGWYTPDVSMAHRDFFKGAKTVEVRRKGLKKVGGILKQIGRLSR